MARKIPFTFLVNTDERKAIASLAKRLERTPSDAVRFVVINAERELARVESSSKSAQQSGAQDATA